MAHLALAQHLAVYPHVQRLRTRAPRMLRPIRPSRANELWYRAKLRLIVDECRKAGQDVLDALRVYWPRPVGDSVRAGDSVSSIFSTAMDRAAARFGGVDMVARRLTNIRDRLSLIRRNLAIVDQRLAEEIKWSVGVDISAVLTDHGSIATKMVEAARANVDLIKSIPAKYLEQVKDAVSEGLATGSRWESLVDRVAEIDDVTSYRAKVIARDQTAKLNSSFNQVRQTDLGIAEYTWSGALDQRERDSHRRMEGVVCRWDSPPSVDGEAVHPGMPVMCRCVALPRLNLDATAQIEEAAE